MSTSDQSNHHLDLRAQVMASPAYKERCNLLFDLFRLGREANKDPKAILELQVGLSEILIHFQEKQAEFREEDNQVGLAVVKRLILILKRIADSIVWRVLGYDRVLVQLLSEHPATGHLDDTVFGDAALAQQIVEQEGAIVLLNDLTTILRHGDLTIIDEDKGIFVTETKYGKATSRDRRAIRQRRRLDKLIRFLNTGFRVTQDRRDFILKVDVPLRTYHSALAEAIRLARQDGYHQMIVSDCLAIEALSTESQRAEFPQEHPFSEVEHAIRFHNLRIFDKPTTRIAPYGIFPLDDRSCFDLITGNMLLVTTLNLDCLQARYNQLGLILQLPQPSEEEIEAYLSAPIAERKKLMYTYKFIVGDGDHYISLTLDLFGRIYIELIHEGTIVQADRQLINLISDLQIPDDRTTRFYIGYRDESAIWA